MDRTTVLARIEDGLESAVGILSAAALGFCALYVGVAVVTLAFNVTPPDEELLISEAMIIVAFLPQIILVRRDMQISVDVAVSRAPAQVQFVLDVFGFICGAIAYGFLGWASWIALDRAYRGQLTYVGDLQILTWPGRAVVVLGVLGAFIACLLKLIRMFRRERGVA